MAVEINKAFQSEEFQLDSSINDDNNNNNNETQSTSNDHSNFKYKEGFLQTIIEAFNGIQFYVYDYYLI
jgi:hypothetical protein